jgi:hypothetical protein
MLRDLNLTGGTGAKPANNIPARPYAYATLDQLLTSAMTALISRKKSFGK